MKIDWNNKKEVMEYWQQKSIDWLVRKLWSMKTERDNYKQESQNWYKESNEYREKNDKNKKLAKIYQRVLSVNRIQQTPLRITFIAEYPEDPNSCDCCEEWCCDECSNLVEQEVTETTVFLEYSIDERLNGITKDYESVEFDNLIKVINAETNEVLYETNR